MTVSLIVGVPVTDFGIVCASMAVSFRHCCKVKDLKCSAWCGSMCALVKRGTECAGDVRVYFLRVVVEPGLGRPSSPVVDHRGTTFRMLEADQTGESVAVFRPAMHYALASGRISSYLQVTQHHKAVTSVVLETQVIYIAPNSQPYFQLFAH